MIKSIQIENLRGIKKCLIENLEQVNILIGKNGAGKSTVLEAVYLASAWAQPFDEYRLEHKLDYVISRRMNRGSWKDSREILWHKLDTSNQVRILLSLEKTTLEFVLADTTTKTIWLKLPRKIDKWHYYSLEQKKATDELFAITGINADIHELVIKTYLGQINFLEKIAFLDQNLTQYGRNFEKKIWPSLLAKRLDKELVSMIKEEYEPQAEGLTYMPIGSEYTLALQLADTTVRVDDLGDGAKNAIIYVAALLTLRNTAVLIEEPETHQHPAGLATVLSFMLKIAKQNNLQLIITTHSIELIKIVQELVRKHELPLKIFYLERTENGIVDVRELKKIDLQILEKLGLDPRFLYIL